jgi:hypothetical protein
VNRRTKNNSLPEGVEFPDLGGPPGFLVEAPYLVGTLPTIVPSSTDVATVRSPDSTIAPDGKGIGRPGMIARAVRQAAADRKPWLAPGANVKPTALVDKNHKFKSRRIKDLWDLFYQFRADFLRPNESDSKDRLLCLLWKGKHDRHSPHALAGFFKECPEIAVWAIWTERAIHETPLRSRKNQSPRIDLLRKCLQILVDAQMNRLAQR